MKVIFIQLDGWKIFTFIFLGSLILNRHNSYSGRPSRLQHNENFSTGVLYENLLQHKPRVFTLGLLSQLTFLRLARSAS